MEIRKTQQAAAWALALTAGIYCPGAMAGDEEQSDDVSLNTVTVTGQKLERTLQETITGVSLATEDDLTRNGALDLSSAFDEMSNVNLVGYGNSNEYAIRGIQSGGVAGAGSVSSVVVDGMPVSRPDIQNNMTLWDIEQVVVAKGPMSTSVGQNSAAGAIFITSKSPQFQPSASLKAGLGSDNLWQLNAMGNLPLSDSLALRVTAERQETDGEYTNIYLNDERHNFLSNSHYKASLLYQPDYRFSARLISGFSNSKHGAALACTDAQSTADYPCEAGDYKAAMDVKPRYQEVSRYGILNISALLSDRWTLSSHTSWRNGFSQYAVDSDRTYPESDVTATFAGQPVSSEYTGFAQDRDQQHISEELKLSFEGRHLHSATGLYLGRERSESEGDSGSVVDLNNLSPAVPADTFYIPFTNRIRDGLNQTRSLAVFNETDIYLPQNLTLTLGLRYSREERRFETRSTVFREMDLTPGDALLGMPAGSLNAMVDNYGAMLSGSGKVTEEDTFTQWLPKIGISWAATADMTLGYVYSSGYRSGGNDLNLGTGAVYEYGQETLKNHEIALRSVWFEQQLAVNANLFYLNWDDQQVSVNGPTNPFDTYVDNAGSSTSRGAELDVFLHLNNGFMASLNTGYADTEFEDFVSSGSDYSGNRFPYSPKINTSLSIGYDRGAGFNTKWRTQYIGSAYTKPSNEQKIDAYYLSHLSVGWKAAQWRGDGYVNNIFDHQQVLYDYQWTKPSANSVTLVASRSWGISTQYDF